MKSRLKIVFLFFFIDKWRLQFDFKNKQTNKQTNKQIKKHTNKSKEKQNKNNYICKSKKILITKKHKNDTHTKSFACDIYIFPKTRGNTNKQWTHLNVLEFIKNLISFLFAKWDMIQRGKWFILVFMR